MAPVLSRSFSILFASPFTCCICSVPCCFLELLAREVAQHTHTRSSCKFLSCAFKRCSCITCQRAKNMLRAFFFVPRMGVRTVIPCSWAGLSFFFLSCSRRLTSSHFQVLPPRRQTPHSSPHLQFAQIFNPRLLVAPFHAVWPSRQHLLLEFVVVFVEEKPVNSCTKTQDSRNVNASFRALNSSPTLDGRRPIYI